MFVLYRKWKIKNIVVLAAHLEACLIKQGMLFFCTSLTFWAYAEACPCDCTPHMPKPEKELLTLIEQILARLVTYPTAKPLTDDQ